jgi:hypothetical protein
VVQTLLCSFSIRVVLYRHWRFVAGNNEARAIPSTGGDSYLISPAPPAGSMDALDTRRFPCSDPGDSSPSCIFQNYVAYSTVWRGLGCHSNTSFRFHRGAWSITASRMTMLAVRTMVSGTIATSSRMRSAALLINIASYRSTRIQLAHQRRFSARKGVA